VRAAISKELYVVVQLILQHLQGLRHLGMGIRVLVIVEAGFFLLTLQKCGELYIVG
jgi:hypothetical protein